MIDRKHSIFGDYILVDKKPPSAGELKDAHAEIVNYNALWGKYISVVVGKWGIGSLPTEKGFAEWLQKQGRKEQVNGK